MTISKEAASKILDDAREKIDEAGMVLGFALFAFDQGAIRIEVMDCYRDTFASDITALSGTTDIECDRCKGNGEVDFLSHQSKTPCPKCNGEKSIKHKWKMAVVLENGEAPAARKPHFDNYTANEVESFIGIARRDLFRAGYVQEVRQVVE